MQSIDCVHSFSSTRTQYEAGEKKVASGILFFDNYITLTHLTFQAVLTAVSLHYDLLMMQQKEARRKHPCVLPKKVAFLV